MSVRPTDILDTIKNLSVQTNLISQQLRQTPSSSLLGEYLGDIKGIQEAIGTLNLLMSDVEETARPKLQEAIEALQKQTRELNDRIQILQQSPITIDVPKKLNTMGKLPDVNVDDNSETSQTIRRLSDDVKYIGRQLQQSPSHRQLDEFKEDLEAMENSLAALTLKMADVEESKRPKLKENIEILRQHVGALNDRIQILQQSPITIDVPKKLDTKGKLPDVNVDDNSETSQTIGRLSADLKYINHQLQQSPSHRQLDEFKEDLEATKNALEALTLQMDDVEETKRPKLKENIEILQFHVGALNDRIRDLRQGKAPVQLDLRGMHFSSAKKEPQYFYASHNQYDTRYAGLHKREDAKNSVCTPTAGCFVLAILQGKELEELDQVIQDGHQLMARLMKDRPPRDGTCHFDFQEILGEKEFEALQMVEIPETQFLHDPQMLQIKREDGAAGFRKALNNLQQWRQENHLPAIGAVFSSLGSSYAIVMADHDHCVFFDSHGDHIITGNQRAFAAATGDIDATVEFLVKKFPRVDRDFINDDDGNVIFLEEDLRTNAIDMTPIHQKAGRTLTNTQPLPAFQLPQRTTQTADEQPPTAIVVQPRPAPQPAEHPMLPHARSLLNIVSALENGEDGLFTAFPLISDLQQNRCIFAMTDAHALHSIGDRLFFHIYFMHKKESPQKLYDVPDYGTQAFQSEAASPGERSRCAQRTLLEVSLQGLAESIEAKDAVNAREYLKILENLKIDAQDLPEGVQNVAHYLFGTLYQNYLKAWEGDHRMIHPHDGAFKSDFGRHAFSQTADVEIPNEYKIRAIDELRFQLKHLWKI